MLIDWFTVFAQTINFLILVWLLRRYLYRPVLAAIDAREAKIAAELKDAAATKTAAQAERDELRVKNETFDRQRQELLRKATDDAASERKVLLDAARKDSEALRSTLNDAVASERNQLNEEIVTRTRQEVFALARKTLGDLAGASLEDRIAEVFIGRLHKLRAEDEAKLPAVSHTDAASALVCSAFALLPATQAAIETAVREWLGATAKLTFKTAPDLVTGIELTVDGRKVAWSISDYLKSLDENVATRLTVMTKDPSVVPTGASHAA
jgi:F-type H+-transporting ATPase subunit b